MTKESHGAIVRASSQAGNAQTAVKSALGTTSKLGSRASAAIPVFALTILTLACALALLAGPGAAWADTEIVASGTSGTCTWTLDDEGTLTVSPTDGISGVLGDSTNNLTAPWQKYHDDIVSAVFEDGVTAGEQAAGLFYCCTNLVSVTGIENLVTSSTTNIKYFFTSCSSLTSLDLSGWDISNVESLHTVFYFCTSLEYLDVSSWDVSNVTTWTSVLGGCTGLRTFICNTSTGANGNTLASYLPDPESTTYGDGTWSVTTSGTTVTYTATFCTSLADAEVTLSSTRYLYDGTAKTPTVTATIAAADKTLTEGVDYTVSYADNTAIGTATVTVKGTGAYSGTATLTFEIIADPNESETNTSYSYEVYYLDSYGDTWYSGCTRVLYIKTDNPDASSISLEVVSGEASISFSTTTYFDIDYTADDSGETLRAVEGGYVVALYFRSGSYSSADMVVGIYETIDGTTTDTGIGFSLTVLDYDDALEAWIDEMIATYTTDDMDSFEKLDAICDVLYENGQYLFNDGTYILYSAAEPNGPKFLSLIMDSYTSPALIVDIAERIGGFDEIDNLYDNYSRGTSEWSMYHYYVACTIGDETQYFTICRLSSTGYVDLDDVSYIDLSDPSSLTATDMSVRFVPYFTDVQDSAKYWYDEVYALADLGYMTGKSSTYFGAYDSLTRAQMVTVLWRIACPEDAAAYTSTVQKATKNTTGMDDVADGAYYTAAVNWAVANGIITGKVASDGTVYFDPSGECTFQQFCVILARYLTGGESSLKTAVSSSEAETTLADFSDEDSVAAYARKAVAYCIENGLVTGYGDNTIRPTTDIERGRAATVIYRAVAAGLLG